MVDGSRRVEDVACTVCGCVCDDLTIEVGKQGIVAAERSCSLSEPWFLDPRNMTSPAPRIAGREAGFDEAVEAAASILKASRAPLVYGLSRSSTPGQPGPSTTVMGPAGASSASRFSNAARTASRARS